MDALERSVAEHYDNAGLLDRIVEALKASGADPDNLGPDDLAPVEEFHIGGRKATAHALAAMELTGNEHLLDVGCGIGGAARFIAAQTGCKVTGIDLTPAYIEAARALTRLTGQDGAVAFKVASALDMPFENGEFDAAITIHVAMNIQDRAALYGEIARVLKPGAVFCVYDVMKIDEAPLTFPVPWAQSEKTSHLTTPEETQALLEQAGFEVRDVEDRSEAAAEFFQQAAAASANGPPTLGVHLVMGADAPIYLRNVRGNMEKGLIAPVQMITVRR